jgi:hypothetical protein
VKSITITLTEAEAESVIHDLCVDLEACEALNAGDEHRNYSPHKEANSVLDKLIEAGATRKNFQAWGRRWDQSPNN